MGRALFKSQVEIQTATIKITPIPIRQNFNQRFKKVSYIVFVVKLITSKNMFRLFKKDWAKRCTNESPFVNRHSLNIPANIEKLLDNVKRSVILYNYRVCPGCIAVRPC